MFYFAHPFGISSPLTTVSSTVCAHRQQPTDVKTQPNFARRNIQHPTCRQTTSATPASYKPWPENTWRRDENILPTLVQALATQMGEFNLTKLYFFYNFSDLVGANNNSQYATA